MIGIQLGHKDHNYRGHFVSKYKRAFNAYCYSSGYFALLKTRTMIHHSLVVLSVRDILSNDVR